MKPRISERIKVCFVVIAVAMVWTSLWYLTMPVYPRFWQFKPLPAYALVIFVPFGFVSLLLYALGCSSVDRIFHFLYWLPIGLWILIVSIWGLAATP